jgi:hypothetical protein
MSTQRKSYLNNEYFKKIEALAVLSLHGQNVKIATHHIVKDICDFARENADTQKVDLLALKDKLSSAAIHAHPSMSGYKSTLEYAASLIVIHKI